MPKTVASLSVIELRPIQHLRLCVDLRPPIERDRLERRLFSAIDVARFGPVTAVGRREDDQLFLATQPIDQAHGFVVHGCRELGISVARRRANNGRERDQHISIFDEIADQGFVTRVATYKVKTGVGA